LTQGPSTTKHGQPCPQWHDHRRGHHLQTSTPGKAAVAGIGLPYGGRPGRSDPGACLPHLWNGNTAGRASERGQSCPSRGGAFSPRSSMRGKRILCFLRGQETRHSRESWPFTTGAPAQLPTWTTGVTRRPARCASLRLLPGQQMPRAAAQELERASSSVVIDARPTRGVLRDRSMHGGDW